MHDPLPESTQPSPAVHARETRDPRTELRNYFRRTRSAFTGIVIGAPLTVAYSLLVLFWDADTQKSDFLIRVLVTQLGLGLFRAIQIGLGLALVIALLWLCRSQRIRLWYFGPLIGESLVYAVLAVVAVRCGVQALHLPIVYPKLAGPLQVITVSLGEAVNHETLFRWLLLEVLVLVGRRVADLGPLGARLFALLLGTTIYAGVATYLGRSTATVPEAPFAAIAMHYLAGAFLSLIYFIRGYPACAYSHLFYSLYFRGVHGC